MECEEPDNGENIISASAAGAAVPRRTVKRKLGAGAGRLRLDDAAALPGAAADRALLPRAAPRRPTLPPRHPTHSPPFIGAMDEITYWIYTKRAPCLMNYDNLLKEQNDAGIIKSKPKSVHSVADDVPSPRKKKKRKLSLLDEDISLDRQKNIYFETSNQNQRTLQSSCKTGSVYSDIDFNIKNSSIQDKRKIMKLKKNCRTTLHKKNKVVTSTPKTCTTLRRSLRKAQNSLNNNTQLNASFEALNCSAVNGNNSRIDHKNVNQKIACKPKVSLENKLANGNPSAQNKNIVGKPKTGALLNREFEDFSDVSGCTANYIRSTKIHSTQTPRNLRVKGSRNLMKESRQNIREEDAMVVYMNKSINTAGLPKDSALNCSSVSSQNAINLITVKNTEKCLGVNRSTSVLKFVEAKTPDNTACDKDKLQSTKRPSRGAQNISWQSRSIGTPRYLTRRKAHCGEDANAVNTTTGQSSIVPTDRRKVNKNLNMSNNSDWKENPDETAVSRTRSGRSIGLALQQAKNSVLVLSNVTEQVSSDVEMNVATEEQPRGSARKKRSSVRYGSKSKQKVVDKRQSVRRDSLRDKSGFAACFSDSDNDCEVVKQRKFFC